MAGRRHVWVRVGVLAAVGGLAALALYPRSSDDSAARGAVAAPQPYNSATQRSRSAQRSAPGGELRQGTPPTAPREAATDITSTPTVSDPYEAPPPGTIPTLPADDRQLTSGEESFRANNGRYLVDVVKPGARECWKKLEGDGTIELRFSFRFENGVASPAVIGDSDSPVTIVESSLDPEQSGRALDCMLDAVEGTTFDQRLPGGEADGTFVVFQVFAVGSPAEAR